MCKMRTIVHIEDSSDWLERVKVALEPLDSLSIVPIRDQEDFRNKNYPRADLYVCDRHLPLDRKSMPNDFSWKEILDTISCLHPYSSVVVLSSHPPADWRRYRNVIDAVKKSKFDEFSFRKIVEFGLEGVTK